MERVAIEVLPAGPDEQPVLANLLELYAHDFSEFLDIDLGADGRFGYTSLPLYWIEPNRYPFLVRINGNLAGFVLVKKTKDETLWDMAEFFVVRRYRKRGIGTKIAHQVWRRFPGPWQVRVMESNPASQFWERAIASFAGQTIPSLRAEDGGKHWRIFRFGSNPLSPR